MALALAGRPERDNGVDFFQEGASARNLLEWLPVYMDLKDAVERHLGLSVSRDGSPGVQVQVEVNAHPPTSVLLVAPLGHLDYPDAVLVWNLLSLVALVISLWLSARALDIRAPAWSVFPIIALMLLCNPLRQQVYLGQFNLILLLLCVGSWLASRSGQPWLAGSLLGLATAIKLFPGFLFVYFVLCRQWKIVGTGVATFVVLTAVTIACLGAETYRSYILEVLPRNERSQSGWKNASLPGWWRKAFDPATQEEHFEPVWRSPALARAGAAASCLVVVFLLAQAVLRAGSKDEQDRAFGLTVIAMLVVSPLAWDHYFVLLLLPLALLAARMPHDWLRRGLFLFLVLILWVDPEIWYPWFIPGGRAGIATPVQVLTALSFQCYALVGLFFFMLWASRGQETPEGLDDSKRSIPPGADAPGSPLSQVHY